ncbi:MAG TPA: DUF1801 domain-containing protein [Chryseolinea sp.]|nr:DUF1801 domain-containing protein [Chryseolinea sp.]HPH45944.1 DUF1801 domain-containing protein [Chryseolinea sp.]HPM32119.1 DUF1801 domain-containing protein [Chryseolinea sp.]
MSRANSRTPLSIDDYIAMQPETFRATLEELRSIIKSVVPKAEELISYQVPSFKLHYILVGIGANKKYCSLYTMSPTLMKSLKKELESLTISGATLHFLPNSKLPVRIIKKIVKARVKENETRTFTKK